MIFHEKVKTAFFVAMQLLLILVVNAGCAIASGFFIEKYNMSEKAGDALYIVTASAVTILALLVVMELQRAIRKKQLKRKFS